jgi:hypothetical protein
MPEVIIKRQQFLVKYKQQANPLLSMNNFTQVVIGAVNEKNWQLKLLRQRKLALTARNHFWRHKIIGKNLKIKKMAPSSI